MYNSYISFVFVITFISCSGYNILQNKLHKTPTSEWSSIVNENLGEFNKLSALLAWKMMTNEVNETMLELGAEIGAKKTLWKNNVCDVGPPDGKREKRMYTLLCRGTRYNTLQARKMSQIMDNMSEAYSSATVCVPSDSWPAAKLGIKTTNRRVCLKGEPDLERLITRQDLTAEQLFWIWKSWHDTVGPQIKKYYPSLVNVLNLAAANNGYNDIGEVWRNELEISNLESVVKELYEEIRPFYEMLHAVVRHALFKKYGSKIVNPNSPIPSHLLGNMWAQDWSALINLLIPNQNLELNEQLAVKNWTIKEMVLFAEDMYASLGLPRMTDKFWKYSIFEKNNESSTTCHGSAANMFDKNDYRILLCAQQNMADFYVIHHELGHIEYYMAYHDQPTIFQEGANSAMQESVGDSIYIGVMVPQHLHRLGLLTDQQLMDKNLDVVLLLQQALMKIPQIPYALLIDLYRWDIFKGKIKPEFYNEAFWAMSKKLRGIAPPEFRGEQYFDAGAKFHVPDNTPYIRYFLSAILQMDMFKGMCEVTLFGNISENNETTIPFPLYRCDIYGSRTAGTKLKKMMIPGASKHWSESLKVLTGRNYITVKPLLEYYKPLYKWLNDYIVTNNVPVGW